MKVKDELRQIDAALRYLSLRREQLSNMMSGEKVTDSLPELAQHTADCFNIGKTMLKGKSRHRKMTTARAAFCYIAAELGHTTTATAKAINRHHTTVMYYQNHGFAQRYRDYTEHRSSLDQLLAIYDLPKPKPIF